VEYKQKTSYCKGDHPDFGGEGVLLSFPQITMVVEQLSFVRYVTFVLHDSIIVLLRLPLPYQSTIYRFITVALVTPEKLEQGPCATFTPL